MACVITQRERESSLWQHDVHETVSLKLEMEIFVICNGWLDEVILELEFWFLVKMMNPNPQQDFMKFSIN